MRRLGYTDQLELIPQVLVYERQQLLPRVFVGSGLTFRRATEHVGALGHRMNADLPDTRGLHERSRDLVASILVRVMLHRMLEAVCLEPLDDTGGEDV